VDFGRRNPTNNARSHSYRLQQPGLVCSRIHVRTSHVHAVVSGGAPPEKMLADFKAYATRALRSTKPGNQRRRFWTKHGSTRYIWNEVILKAASDYVLNQQGTPMAHYPGQIRSLTLPAPMYPEIAEK